ncbi:MAG: hypothetical protein K2N82_05780, partial [Lachnospiraceae bacterium]|nr:hypothetical protein [Lachnospiraceae bacterium]
MRIDSSSIGMESARRFSSVSGRVSKFVITNGRQSLKDGTGALFGNLLGTDVGQEQTQAKKQENTTEELQKRLDEIQARLKPFGVGNIRNNDTTDTGKQLSDIRNNFIIF